MSSIDKNAMKLAREKAEAEAFVRSITNGVLEIAKISADERQQINDSCDHYIKNMLSTYVRQLQMETVEAHKKASSDLAFSTKKPDFHKGRVKALEDIYNLLQRKFELIQET